jgi:hypothetical protein
VKPKEYAVGTIETGSADLPGRHEFTQQEREHGQRTSAQRARQQRVTLRRRFRRWAQRDRLLYEALEDARAYGTEQNARKAERAWAEHQLTMPIRGRSERSA